jgi:hypothetical protein
MTEMNRTPAGAPTGGEFAATARPDNQVTLDAPAPVLSDENCMDRIAVVLGSDPEWNGSADYLEATADLVAAAGRPHPGNTDPDEYARALGAVVAGRQGPASATTEQLDEIALLLGTDPEWGADHMTSLATAVGATGRPYPGAVEPDAYVAQIALGAADRADTLEAKEAILLDGISACLLTADPDRRVTAWKASPCSAGEGEWTYDAQINLRNGDGQWGTLDVAGTPTHDLLVALADRQFPYGQDDEWSIGATLADPR